MESRKSVRARGAYDSTQGGSTGGGPAHRWTGGPVSALRALRVRARFSGRDAPDAATLTDTEPARGPRPGGRMLTPQGRGADPVEPRHASRRIRATECPS